MLCYFFLSVLQLRFQLFDEFAFGFQLFAHFAKNTPALLYLAVSDSHGTLQRLYLVLIGHEFAQQFLSVMPGNRSFKQPVNHFNRLSLVLAECEVEEDTLEKTRDVKIEVSVPTAVSLNVEGITVGHSEHPNKYLALAHHDLILPFPFVLM